jgi:hypothetical protein
MAHKDIDRNTALRYMELYLKAKVADPELTVDNFLKDHMEISTYRADYVAAVEALMTEASQKAAA